MASNYACTAYKAKGNPHAQNVAQRKEIKPDLMYRYHVKSATIAANNHFEGYVYVNKAFNASNGFANGDTLTLTIVSTT